MLKFYGFSAYTVFYRYTPTNHTAPFPKNRAPISPADFLVVPPRLVCNKHRYHEYPCLWNSSSRGENESNFYSFWLRKKQRKRVIIKETCIIEDSVAAVLRRYRPVEDLYKRTVGDKTLGRRLLLSTILSKNRLTSWERGRRVVYDHFIATIDSTCFLINYQLYSHVG